MDTKGCEARAFSQLPRKGTETQIRADTVPKSECFQPITPQGDGNLIPNAFDLMSSLFQPITPQGDGNRSLLLAFLTCFSFSQLPRKGTETEIDHIFPVL